MIAERDNAKKSNKRNKSTYVSENELAYENKIVLDELILRQDSIEEGRIAAFEERFDLIVRMLRNDIDTTIKRSLQDFSAEKNTSYVANDTNFEKEPANVYANNRRESFKEVPVKMRVDSGAVDINSGYYFIANVYSTTKYLNAFIEELKSKGLNPKQFYNKENSLYYVYLAYYDNEDEAQIAASTNLDGRYNKEKWIMQVN